MLIFVEGIDKAGKSTFIRGLSELTQLPVYRKKPPVGLSEEDSHNFFKGVGYALVELHNLLRFDAIIDRSFISDWVYINRNEHKKNISIWLDWEARQNIPIETLIVYLTIPNETFAERMIASPDKYMTLGDYDRYTELYNEYLQQTTLPYAILEGHIPFEHQYHNLCKWVASYISSPLKDRLDEVFPSFKSEVPPEIGHTAKLTGP